MRSPPRSTPAAAARRRRRRLPRSGWAVTPAKRSSATAPTSATTVTRAARLLTVAHGGQVLVSDATEVLAARPGGVAAARASTVCAGVTGAMPVFQVVADGLPADFPVLRSVDDFPGNLPQQLHARFVGREPVVGDGGRAGAVRSPLVTLTGRRRRRQDPPRARGRRRSGRRVPRRGVVDRAGRRSVTARRCPPRSPPCSASRPQGGTPLGRHHRRGAARSADAARARQLRTPHRRGPVAVAGHAVRRRRTSGSSPRRARTSAVAGETVVAVEPLAVDGGGHPTPVDAVRRSGPCGAPRLRARRSADRRRGDRDLRGARRAPARHRARGGRGWRR